jgi:hypothetical protein
MSPEQAVLTATDQPKPRLDLRASLASGGIV